MMFVENAEGLYDLTEVCEGKFLVQKLVFLEDFFEVTTVTELVDKVKIVDCFEHVEVSDDMGTGLEISEDADLVICAFFQFGKLFELLSFDHLDRYLLLGFHVDCLIDSRVHSSSDLAL